MPEVAVLRAVLDELCAAVPLSDTGTRTNVASALLAASKGGAQSLDDLKQAGTAALQQVPTMWRGAFQSLR